MFPHRKILTAVAVLGLSLLSPKAFGQSTVKAPLQKQQEKIEQTPDYSQEAVVIEEMKTSYRFEKDGTGQHEMTARVRVQSEAALTQFGQLIFPYVSVNEDLNIDYVRVKKTDGHVITASASDVQDLTAPISREAPVYTDARQKHVTVPGLRPGDTLEYHVVWKVHTPLAANHFWLNHDFIKRDLIILDEQLEINIPSDSVVKLKTEKGFEPVIKEHDGRRFYYWKRSVLKREEEKDDDKEAARKRKQELEDPPPPTVQMTTFKSWDEVGQWYAELERDRLTPDDRIRAKVEELIHESKTDQEKIEALYEFVAKNFRYVSLSLGQGRYQPHAAREVMANQYGDCKDKHTLFSSMLIAAGFRAYPALMNSSRKIDPDVPSPGQFDHVISAIPRGADTWWADTTAEVAPFRLLSAVLRDKKALLIPANSPAHLETTPADPPFVSSENVEVEAQVGELGKLTGQVRMVMHGDAEMIFRMLLRRTPKANWKDFGYYLASAMGMRGADLTDINASDIEALHTPFEVTYKFSVNDFLDWSAKKLTVSPPFPDVTLPNIDADKEEGNKPIRIGVPIDITYRLKLTLPTKYNVRPPVPLNIKRDYASYSSTYRLEGNTLLAERQYHSRLHELPPERTSDYRAFAAATQSDAVQTMTLETTTVADSSAVPDSVKVEDLIDAAEAAAKNNNYVLVESLLKRVLEKEPKHKTVRQQLGYALFVQGKLEETVKVMREQTTQNPYDQYAYSLMGRAQWAQQNYAEAEKAFRKQLEIAPLDKYAHGNVGLLLVEWRKYQDAIPELEQAISLNPDNEADYQIGLGRAYLNLNETNKAIVAFDRAVKLAPGQRTWNNIAYYLSLSKVNLDKAQQYAESSVTELSTALRNVELDRLTEDDLQNVNALAASWDTLGWVFFQKGDLDTAERYITAAWRLAEHGEVGYHLGQIYEKRGKIAEATHVYALASIGSHTVPEAQESLERLLGKTKAADKMVREVPNISATRTIELGASTGNVKGATEARFFVSLVPGPNRNAQVVDVKFITGDEKLKPLASMLKTANYEFVFPDEKITKIIRRGTLSCLSKDNQCTFIMMSPDYVPID